MFKSIASTVAAALLAGAVVSSPAAALSITHNGVGTGGIVALATEALDVELIDVMDAAPASSFAAICASGQADACLMKSWYVAGTHTMVVTPDAATTIVGEFVFNFSDTPWTDYHISVTGADPGSFGYGFFTFDDEGEVIDATTAGITTAIDGNSLSLFFADSFSSLDTEGSVIALGVIFDADGDGTFTIEQYPTFGVPEPAALGVMGLGLAAMALMRRRRRR